MTVHLDVLCAGYAVERVASTVVLIRDEGAVIVVDPGMVADRRQILARWRSSVWIRPRSVVWCLATTIPAIR
jgi:glyoxylase-like metal-dependent hydrolase (beta-lactamase superfamily II)